MKKLPFAFTLTNAISCSRTCTFYDTHLLTEREEEAEGEKKHQKNVHTNDLRVENITAGTS